MKKLLVVVIALLMVSCASLPMPDSQSSTGHFVIPVFAENDSSQNAFAFYYQFKIESKRNGSTFLKNVKPSETRTAEVITNLPAGHYCTVGYYVIPANKAGHDYTYKPTLREYKNCFQVVANRLTVWDTKVKVRLSDLENERGRYTQQHWFRSLENSDRAEVEKSLNRFDNIDQWMPVNYQ
jgi:hypothetical protein